MKESRKKILMAAARVFSQRGFHQARMDEIAEAAGVAKGTLYYNFAGKSQLFSATVTEGVAAVIEEARAALQSELPFVDHLRQLIACNVDLYLEYSDLARIVFNEVSAGIDDAARGEIETMRGRYIDFLADQLRIGREKGYIRDCDLRLTAIGLAGMLDSLCNRLLQRPGEIAKDEIVTFMHGLLKDGLVTSKPKKR